MKSVKIIQFCANDSESVLLLMALSVWREATVQQGPADKMQQVLLNCFVDDFRLATSLATGSAGVGC